MTALKTVSEFPMSGDTVKSTFELGSWSIAVTAGTLFGVEFLQCEASPGFGCTQEVSQPCWAEQLEAVTPLPSFWYYTFLRCYE